MRDHRRLEVFRLADSLTLQIYARTQRFPEEERYGLTSQLRRAAVSVGTNIVEGAARRSTAEFVHFLSVAYASACEVQYELSLAVRLGYLRDASAVSELSNRTCKALRGLISTIQRSTK